jgi:hypothetical protein
MHLFRVSFPEAGCTIAAIKKLMVSTQFPHPFNFQRINNPALSAAYEAVRLVPEKFP